ncbi:hypothetical protein [Haloarcula montana]|uniref:hypothetical protein n=1 Tax=Haloarcula montana TaxID=3111776 RepID=UPI002D7821BF|nr:hypothetical protein [Haloarcula sp. GH36]
MPGLPSINVSGSRLLLGSTTEWRRRREDLSVHNDSSETAHEVRITVRDDGGVCHEETYRLNPGQSGCSLDLLSDGRYTVAVTLENDTETTATVFVGDTPARTIVVRLTDDDVTIEQGHE